MTRWILVVEDEKHLGRMICDNLELDGYGTELLHDGASALERLERGGLDLVVLDVMLPRRNGFEVLAALRRGGDQTPVLILSARSDDDDRIRGLELAADDYLTKPFNLRELLLRVSSLLRRSNALGAGEDLLCFGGNTVDFRSQHLRTWRGEEVALTASETRLIRLLATRDGAVVTRKEIVEHLFGPSTPLTSRTVDNLVLRLRKLLERSSRSPRHLETMRGRGWRLVTDP